jgi:hypothetical protein
MYFELTNVTNTFITIINHVLHAFIDKFIILCFYDIIIYNKHLRFKFLSI